MIKIECIKTYGWEAAFRGMRNPMNSWERSDSLTDDTGEFVAGVKDLMLAENLCRSGSDHRKFLRQIGVSMDITAPLYWWKEFDTYKVGTVANSCSTMHKIHEKEFTRKDFSHDHLDPAGLDVLDYIISVLNIERDNYNRTKNKDSWWPMIQLLPCSFNQLRTVTLNYEVLRNMVGARKGHKLDEWREFCRIAEGLPYARQLILSGKEGEE